MRRVPPVELKTVDKPTSLKPGQALVKVLATSCNATDINQFVGAYNPGQEPPFDCGFEGIVQVESLGESTAEAPIPESVKVGALCLGMGSGFYSEYAVVDAKTLIPGLPSADPKFLNIPISAMTSAIALGEQGGLKGDGPSQDDVVLVTAAAGGAGQFAVQLAKKVYKCKTVIGTCSSDEKAAFLKKIGCDIVIDYKKENVGEFLKKNFPKGIDVIYESVGGELFEQCLASLAEFGRLIVIGSITGYTDQTAFQRKPDAAPIQRILLSRSARMCGFMLPSYRAVFPKYLPNLIKMVATGELVAHVDETAKFEGIEKVPDAISHLHSGKSFGKVVIKL